VTDGIDYAAPAELYSSVASFRKRVGHYQRFATAAEAIRFAIEEMPSAALGGVSIESGDTRHEGDGIRALYNAPGYPLPRPAR
jgi:hypothetical protein